MFPHKKRLSREDFPHALHNGKRVSSTHLTAVLPEKALGYAVVVSKKTAHLSVTRHRIKRKVLAALRSLPSLPPSVIIFPKPSILHLDVSHIQSELIDLITDRTTKRIRNK